MIHLVWIPKYRKRVLSGKLASRVDELLRICAEANGWKTLELNVQPDHVHMVVQFVPTIAVSKMVQILKTKSSRIIRKEFPDLEEVYWNDSFWSDDYFAETAAKYDQKRVIDYVRNQ